MRCHPASETAVCCTVVTYRKYSLQGRKVHVSLSTESTVAELKERVHDSEGIAPEYQCLMFKGMTVQDTQTLKELGVDER